MRRGRAAGPAGGRWLILEFQGNGNADRAGGLDLDEVAQRLVPAVRAVSLITPRSPA